MSDNVTSIEDLSGQIATPQRPIILVIGPHVPDQGPDNDTKVEASLLFRSLNDELEPDCLRNKSTWWFRTYEGHCNWLKRGESGEGSIGSARPRDYQQYTYADDIPKPREGPNPRATSNSIFKRKKTIYYEHTPLLLGLIEGSTTDIAHRLRSKVDGKLLMQEVQSPGTRAKASYLPFNSMGVPTNTRPGVEPEGLFAGGDPRTNEDWLLLGIHILLLQAEAGPVR
ncbi:hypothetical protein QL093DRAFT_2086910 [Fusarium oxysporum]|nr:hypothetical protein QL093DRAFT_2086910 [Fusarium oxysporum]